MSPSLPPFNLSTLRDRKERKDLGTVGSRRGDVPCHALGTACLCPQARLDSHAVLSHTTL